MAKICILGDTHFGMRNDSQVFMDYAERFYTEIFFPYLVKNNIKTIIQLGDFFDRRKYINFLTLHRTYKSFIDQLEKHDIQLKLILGNHDVFFKNTNELNSLELLVEHKEMVTVYTKPTQINDVLLVPWMTQDNKEECLKAINDSADKYCMGHFEIAGFAMYKGMTSEEGVVKEMFSKFDRVFSGHYHHKSIKDNIMYVGTPLQMTWQDYGDPKGFHILDTDTGIVDFIHNPYEIFHQIPYDDLTTNSKLILKQDFEQYSNTYVKVIVANKTDPTTFDKFMTNLEKVNPCDVIVYEDFTIRNEDEDDQETIDATEDTLTIINKYIDTVEGENFEPNRLKDVIKNLYNEAMNREEI